MRFYKKRGKNIKKLCKYAKSSRAVHNLFIFVFYTYCINENSFNFTNQTNCTQIFHNCPGWKRPGSPHFTKFFVSQVQQTAIFFSSIPMYTVKCKNAAGSDVPAAFCVTVQPCAGLNEKVCCKLACISTFSSKSAYGGTTKLLVFMNMKTRRCNG